METIVKVCAVADSTVVLLARVKKSDNTYLIQSDVTSVRVDLYDLTAGTGGTTIRTPVDATGTTISDGSAFDTPATTSVVYNALQTDSRWSVDSTGYNVAYKITPPLIDHIYEARLTFALTDADHLVLAYQITAK